jgi:hypothetical protein
MKLWIDDVRPAPKGYVWCKSVNEAKAEIVCDERQQREFYEKAPTRLRVHDLYGYHKMLEMCNRREIELIDLDHDAGDYTKDGGDYIKLLDWLEETGRNYPIRIHSQNPVGVANMRAIIERNGWKEIR